MISRLYVLQHGNAVSKEENPDRPLSMSGRRDIERLAEYLASKKASVQCIVHSGKLRAEQTAIIISDKLTPGMEPEILDGINPNDEVEKFIYNTKDKGGAMLIASHLPFVSRLVSTLITGSPDAQLGFTPGTVACVDCVEEEWSLVFMMRPGDL